MTNPENVINNGFRKNPQNIRPKKKGDVHQKTRLKKIVKELTAAGKPHLIDEIWRAMGKKATVRQDVSAAKLILEAWYEPTKSEDTNDIKHEIIAFLYQNVEPAKVADFLNKLEKGKNVTIQT